MLAFFQLGCYRPFNLLDGGSWGRKASNEQADRDPVQPSQPGALPLSSLRYPWCLLLSWVALLVLCGPASAQTVAVFDFELIDTSLQGEIGGARADEQARLARLGDQLRRRLADSGRFSLVDIAPIASEARASNLQACGGCDAHLARRVGAELAVTGTVQKVSNLILNMSVYVRDAYSGGTIAAVSADMRGNTDKSWSRTLDWLVRNRLLAPGYGAR